jgi:hypothetical protein
MSENQIKRWLDDDRLVVDDLEVKRLAAKYRITMGQVRGLIARYGMDTAKLDARRPSD